MTRRILEWSETAGYSVHEADSWDDLPKDPRYEVKIILALPASVLIGFLSVSLIGGALAFYGNFSTSVGAAGLLHDGLTCAGYLIMGSVAIVTALYVVITYVRKRARGAVAILESLALVFLSAVWLWNGADLLSECVSDLMTGPHTATVRLEKEATHHNYRSSGLFGPFSSTKILYLSDEGEQIEVKIKSDIDSKELQELLAYRDRISLTYYPATGRIIDAQPIDRFDDASDADSERESMLSSLMPDASTLLQGSR